MGYTKWRHEKTKENNCDLSPLPQINGFFNFQTSFKFYSAPSVFLTLHWEVTTLQTFLYQAGPSLNLCFVSTVTLLGPCTRDADHDLKIWFEKCCSVMSEGKTGNTCSKQPRFQTVSYSTERTVWRMKSEILKEPQIRPTVLSLYTWTITMWFKHFVRQCGTGLHRWGMSYKASWKSKEVCKQYPLNKQEANVFREHHRSNMAVCSDVQLWPCSMTTCKA